jgi:hypothetical protein
VCLGASEREAEGERVCVCVCVGESERAEMLAAVVVNERRSGLEMLGWLLR